MDERRAEDEQCPLCRDTPGKPRRGFVKHLGRHMEEIALTALPQQEVDDSEHDSSSVNQASLSQSEEARVRAQALPPLPLSLEAHPEFPEFLSPPTPLPPTLDPYLEPIPEFPAIASPLIPPQKAQRESWPTVAAPKTDQLREPLLPSAKTPTARTPALKALPTIRDHKTNTLAPEGDEYIPREFDKAGERKVSPQGHALDGREFKLRTFSVSNRGEKMFMLANQCATVLRYRDSNVLFNKNRSLYKIITTQAEKDELIHREILPYCYRSREIAIVTAKSMFRQFGAHVFVDGRRVKDGYWEAKARNQGFTEDDLAGEKRRGVAKRGRRWKQHT
ncbi:hypothetical protein MMC21_007406 [Puttea exsequens]|nr:hypothetical protein [Puttea exsequens]